MQIRSRDLAWPENLKPKTATVYTNSNLTSYRILFVFSFNNKGHYVLVPSLPMRVISSFRLLF